MIAGASGLIGSACVRLLSRYSDVCLFSPARAELDLADRNAVLAYLQANAITSVIFAAGKVGGIVENRDHPATFIDENLVVGLNGLWAAHHAKVKRMIVFGSSCMYPVDAPQPMHEDVLNSGPIEPTSVAYATAKMAIVQAALAYNRQYPKGTCFIPVIPNSTFGPRDNFDSRSSHVMAALIGKIHAAKQQGKNEVTIWGTGQPRREFVYCDDVASACAFLLAADLANIRAPFNIASGHEVSIADLAQMIANIVGYRGRFTFDSSMPDGAGRKVLSDAKLSNLGWRASCSIEAGIATTYDWFKKNVAERNC